MTTELASTEAERAERLREHLEGTSPRGGMRGLQAAPAANVLWGVALHTAAKIDAGTEMSDLERLLATAVLSLLPQDEVKAMGRAWESARARGEMPLFPRSVTALGTGESYSRADLVRDMPAIGKELLDQPNTSVVHLDKPESQALHTADFTEAAAAAGHGMTVVRGPQMDSEILRDPVSVELYLPYFNCIRGTGDSAFGPDDEIYWTMASGSDLGSKHQYGSPEYGSMSAGQKRNFPPGTNVFLGMVKSVVCCDIECWEKDRGGFWDTIKNTLGDVSDACLESAAEIMENGGDSDAGLIALAGIVGKLLEALLDVILGKDDIIEHHTLAFDRPAIETLINRSINFDFEGENGHYTLHIGARKLPSAMRFMTLDEGAAAWSAPQNMVGMHSLSNPGAVANDGLLYCLVRRPGTDVLDFTSYDGHIWSTPEEVQTQDVASGVSVEAHNGTVYYVYRSASTEDPVVCSITPDGETEWHGTGLWDWTPADPDLVAYKSDLYCVYRDAHYGGLPNTAVRQVRKGNEWPDPDRQQHHLGRLGPVIAVHDVLMHMVQIGISGDELQHSVSNGMLNTWTPMKPLGGHFSHQRPGLASFGGKLHCVYRGHNNNALWWTHYSNGEWAQAKQLRANCDSGPALAVFDNQLYCIYHDNV
ncbi:hypothetical protein [Streptomyces sp. NPDC058612]|uniref:hypothetical protein n=1 Tax=Streptomyces sp. NPDC058612 TaxID=3346555 RepID=UPI003652D837